MKKILVATILALSIPGLAFADRGEHHREPPRYEHHRGGVNPWPFIAGAVVGGIIVNEVSRDRVEEYRPPMRYITVCENIELYDVNGYYVKTERQCRRELVPVN